MSNSTTATATTSVADPLETLRALARSCGIQVEYVDTSGVVQTASEESLFAVLRALGVHLGSVDDAAQALLDRELRTQRRLVEPVLLVWDGVPVPAEIRLPADQASAEITCRLVADETAATQEWTVAADSLTLVGSADLGGERFVTRHLPLPLELATGYHRLTVTVAGLPPAEALVIAAPSKAYTGAEDHGAESSQGNASGGSFARCSRSTAGQAGGPGTTPTSKL